MASTRIRKRADGTLYTAVLFREDGAQRSMSFDDHAEALQVAKLITKYGPAEGKRIHGIQQQHADSGDVLTVEKYLTAHIEGLTGVEHATRTKYRGYLRRDIAPTIGDIPLHALARDDLATWLRGLPGSTKTVSNKLVFMSGALNAAVLDGTLPANPARGLHPSSGLRREPVFLTPAEFSRIRAALPEHWRPLATWLVTTGTRFAEATALRIGDIDTPTETARITRAWKDETNIVGPPKSRAGIRTINVPASSIALLDLTRPASELLFVTPRGTRVTRQEFHRAWVPAREAAGFTGDRIPRTHDLRHTNASWLLNAGTPLMVVSRHLGHASISVTSDTYGHLDRSVAKLAADTIGKMLD